MAKKTSSFNKHVYSLIAVIVLLVAAGIASYAVAPAGSASHGTLYADNIYGKTGNIITVKDKLVLDGLMAPPILFSASAFNAAGQIKAIEATFTGDDGVAIEGSIIGSSNSVGVKGISGSNTGKLGTANAGVEGTVDDAAGFGVYGKQSSSGFAVKGLNTDSTNYGQLGGNTVGVQGYSVSGYAVSGSTGVSGLAGVYGFTTNPAGYGGQFTGGKGLFASKIVFGADAFSATNGYLVLAATPASPSCSNICTAHGMGCYDGFLIGGGDSSCALIGSFRYCWCD